jgi:hypothetical protein
MGTPKDASAVNTQSEPPLRPRSDAGYVLDYRTLRVVIGGIAILLVLVVYFGNWFLFTRALRVCVYSPHWVPGSLSGFYYTHMRNLFVGAMCAMGVFFAAYRGYDRWDNRLTNLAGIAAICIALSPTTPPFYSTSPTGRPNLFFTGSNPCGPSTPITYHLSPHQSLFKDVHMVSLIVLFVMVFLMVLVQFTRATPSDAEQQPAPEGLANRIRAGWNAFCAWGKSLFPVRQLVGRVVAWWKGLFPKDKDQRRTRRQNKVFVACAVGIILAALLALVAAIWSSLGTDAPLLLFSESLAFFSFGIAWLVKGGPLRLIHRGAQAPREDEVLLEKT